MTSKSWTYPAWLHEVRTQKLSNVIFTILPPTRGNGETPEEIALYTDCQDQHGRAAIRSWSKHYNPNKLSWETEEDRTKAIQMHSIHEKMVKRMRLRNDTELSEREIKRKKKAYANLTTAQKKAKIAKGDQKKKQRKKDRRTNGLKMCEKGQKGCGAILPISDFSYAMAEVEGAEDYHNGAESFVNKVREQPVCKKCRKANLEMIRTYISRRDPEQEKLKSREYEKRPDVIAMRKRWRENNPELTRARYKRYREAHREERNAINKERLRVYRTTEQYRQYKMKYDTSLNRMMSSYRNRAGWKLTEEEGQALLLSECCFYCGAENEYADENDNGHIRMTIDRVCPDGDYETGNVVPCCNQCNIAKGISDLDVFLELCRNVWLYRSRGVAADAALPLYHSHGHKMNNETCEPCNYPKYKSTAMKRNIEFKLTALAFDYLSLQPCHYCGCPPKNGVDRVDSSIGYCEENCVPCCSLCNHTKNSFSENEFLTMCFNVNSLHGLLDESE